jgi:hypothetical protein
MGNEEGKKTDKESEANQGEVEPAQVSTFKKVNPFNSNAFILMISALRPFQIWVVSLNGYF